MNKIVLATIAQAVLMELELKGQVSDGYWENSSPRDHYKPVCDAAVIVDPDNMGINFYPRRKYNFASPTLIEYVGERMRQYVLFNRKFPELSMKSLRSIDSGDWIWMIKVGVKTPEWQQQFHDEMKKVCGVTTYEECQALLKEIDLTEYPISSLKKDLKAINDAFKKIIE